MKRNPVKFEDSAEVQERICGLIRERIAGGLYHAGDKISSVREMSRQQRVSITAVLDAYRRLEMEGVVLAQPQSGFYVQIAATRKLAVNARTEPPRMPIEPNHESIVGAVLHDSRNAKLVQMGTASPNTSLLPASVLTRLLSRAVREETETAMGYSGPMGLRPLREQVARRMLAAGVSANPDDIIITNGGSESLSLCLRAVCQPGDIIAVESPTYYAMLVAAKSLGLKVLEVSTHPTDGIDLDELEALIGQYPIKAVVLTPTFGNPLGHLMPEENKSALVHLLESKGISLIEDDVYGDLGFAPNRPPAAKAFDRTGNVLYCSSFSKTLAPGFRIGWVIGGPYKSKLELLKFASSGSTSSPQQIAIAEFLAFQRYAHHVRSAIRVYHDNSIQMANAVRSSFPEGTHVNKPQGGFVLWVRMPKEADSLELYRNAIKQGIVFMPGSAFSVHTGAYSNCLRLNCAKWNTTIERAILTLGDLAKQQIETGSGSANESAPRAACGLD